MAQSITYDVKCFPSSCIKFTIYHLKFLVSWQTSEHDCRFFYENLWREWDRDDGDYPYAIKILQKRLQFYYDMEQENLSSDFIRQYKGTVS